MGANDFIAKLKANRSGTDRINLDEAHESYKNIVSGLSPDNKERFSLNVLCTICRNLEKVPSWKKFINSRALLSLSIDCVRATRSMGCNDRLRTLACNYHIHRYAVNEPTCSAPPLELVLKISYMPFEVGTKHLLTEYKTTYGNIITDRLTYIEKLNHKGTAKLIPKLAEHLLKIIEIYDPIEFCSSFLVMLVKRLSKTFNECRKELNGLYVEIFKKLSTVDQEPFKNLIEKDKLELYIKFNACLYVVVENSSKLDFRSFPLDVIVIYCITMLGHSADMLYCFQTFYSNCFCRIFAPDNEEPQTVLNELLVTLSTTENFNYKQAKMATYPFLMKFFILFIECKVEDFFDSPTQEICFNIMLTLMKKLKTCKPLVKCDKCPLQTGLHNSLHLSLWFKKLIKMSLDQNLLGPDIQAYILCIMDEQYNIIMEIKELGCANFDKTFKKIQTDTHNCAIAFSKPQYYEFASLLFDKFIKYELSCNKTVRKNISRALFNKSLCEVNSKLYEDALIDAFLSQLFVPHENLTTEKYMCLIVDIKSKQANNKVSENDTPDKMQYFTVIDAWKYCVDTDYYGVKNRLQNIPFKELLEHEFAIYSQYWPSLPPIAGICRTLLEIYKNKFDDIIQVKHEEIFCTLIKLILKSASTVRTIHNDHFEYIVMEILDIIENMQEEEMTTDLKIAHAALLFLKTEYSVEAASTKYSWNSNDSIEDLNDVQSRCALPEEHAVFLDSFKAVQILTQAIKQLSDVKNQDYVHSALPIFQVLIFRFLHFLRLPHALQLAYICCQLAESVNDTPTYIKNAGVILYHSVEPSSELDKILKKSVEESIGLTAIEHLETVVIFLCETSIYYTNIGSSGEAAGLVQLAQAKILHALQNNPEINLEMGKGRLLEAQSMLCELRVSKLSTLHNALRHYLGISYSGRIWSAYRAYFLCVRYHTECVSLSTTYVCRRLYLLERATAAALASLQTACALLRAMLYLEITDPNVFDDAEFKVNHRLKPMIGLQSTTEIPERWVRPKEQNSSQLVEPVRENLMSKRIMTSPYFSRIMIPPVETHEFLLHDDSCECYACALPISFLIACRITALEASMYFKAEDDNIADNFFQGALKMLRIAENKFREQSSNKFEDFIAKNIQKTLIRSLKVAEIEILIELSYLELKQKKFNEVDKHIIIIHDIRKELGSIETYLNVEVLNLMVASAEARKPKPLTEDELRKYKFFEPLPGEKPSEDDLRENEIFKSPVHDKPSEDDLKEEVIFKTPLSLKRSEDDLRENETLTTSPGLSEPPKRSPYKNTKKVKTCFRNLEVIKLNLDDSPDVHLKIPNKTSNSKNKNRKRRVNETIDKLLINSFEEKTPNTQTSLSTPKRLITQPLLEASTPIPQSSKDSPKRFKPEPRVATPYPQRSKKAPKILTTEQSRELQNR